jgi:hypothetical protein
MAWFRLRSLLEGAIERMKVTWEKLKGGGALMYCQFSAWSMGEGGSYTASVIFRQFKV